MQLEQVLDVARVEDAARRGTCPRAGVAREPGSSPRNQRASGTAKPCFCRSMIASGRMPRIACLKMYFVVPSLQPEARRNRGGELHELVVEQRRPRLDRMRHRHPIDLGQDVERQVAIEIVSTARRRASRRRLHARSARERPPTDRAARSASSASVRNSCRISSAWNIVDASR